MPAGRKKKAPTSKKRLVFDEPEEERANTTTAVRTPQRKKQKKLDSFTSPAKSSSKTAAAAVTPEEKESEKLSKYVPKYVHKCLDYKRQGEATLDDTTLAVFRLVKDHYVIPQDFEQLRKYGPLSGTSFEQRVISEYSLGKLTAKSKNDVKICTCCAELGHKRMDCPTLI